MNFEQRQRQHGPASRAFYDKVREVKAECGIPEHQAIEMVQRNHPGSPGRVHHRIE
jgi:hypothetical protein